MKALVCLFTLLLATTALSSSIKKVDYSKIRYVSLVYADTAQGLESSFGHIGIRLSENEGPSLYDISAEFVADTTKSGSAIEMYIRGAGIYNPFPVVIQYDYFDNYTKKKSVSENRKIETIRLKLTDEELKNFLNFMDDFQNGVISQKYYFLTANCAEIPIRALEVAIGQKIKWSNIPMLAIDSVKSMSIYDSSTIIENSSTKRATWLDKYILNVNDRAGFDHESLLVNFRSDIEAPTFEGQYLSYLKLLWLRQEGKISKNNFRKLYVNYKTVSVGIDKYMLKLALNPKFATKRKIILKTKKVSNRAIVGSSKAIVKIGNDSLFAKVTYRVKPRHKERLKKIKSIEHVIDGAVFDSTTREISFNGNSIGAHIDNGSEEFFLLNTLGVKSELVEAGGEKYINTFIEVSLDDNSNKMNRPSKLIKAKGHISLLNTDKRLNGGIGACYALVMIQQALFERALFSDTKLKPDSKTSIGLLESLMKGQYVIIQGFSNITDFTSSINTQMLVDFVNKVQNSINGSIADAFWDSLFNRSQLTADNLSSLKALLRHGHSVPMQIAYMDISGDSPKLASQTGHVIYVHKLTEIEAGKYKVLAYDPNFGTSEYYILQKNKAGNLTLEFTKKMKLITNTGPFELWPIFDVINPEKVKSRDYIKLLTLKQKSVDKHKSGPIYGLDFLKLYK